MKQILFLCLMVLLSESAGYCAAVYFPPLKPTNSVPEQIQSYENTSANLETASNISYSRISEIEQSLFGKTYQGQNIAARLSRIEKNLFNKTYPNSTNLQRLDNVVSNYNQINKCPNISVNVLSKMERQVFNQAFPQYNIQRRLERLEQQILGATQQGDMSARYELLKTAARNYKPQNVLSPYEDSGFDGATVGSTRRRGLLGSLGSLGGTMTGFTPPINPYSAYGMNNNYSSNPYGYTTSPGYSTDGSYNSTGPFGTSRGYYSSNGSYGSGVGVTIID